jgi:GNAT superfamily N-acetyltransferase
MNKPANIIIDCRPAIASDTDDVMELVRTIWDGDDYIPFVWKNWLADSHGLLAVGEYDSHVVGLGKLTRISSSDWWLEGLRTHPEYQGRGIANQIFDFLISTWLRIGQGTVRLATHSENYAVHHMCEKKGFKRRLEIVIYNASPLAEQTNGFQKILPGEEERVFQIFSKSRLMKLNGNLMDIGWTWTAPSLSIIGKTIEQGLAWWWFSPDKRNDNLSSSTKPQGLLLLTLDEEIPEGPPHAKIQGIHCSKNHLIDLLKDYRRLVGHNGYLSAGWNVANHIELVKAAVFSNFVPSWDRSLFIYARSI